MKTARRPRPPNPFRWFDSSPGVIRLVIIIYVPYPLSLRNLEDLLHERAIDLCYETVRLWSAAPAPYCHLPEVVMVPRNPRLHRRGI